MIFYALSVLVFFIFIAALLGCLFFTCVLIDAFTIWWCERRGQ